MQSQRLEPLGASDDKSEEIINKNDCDRCISLEDERDLLQSSLIDLTTHFAQVQFRLRQVVNAPFEEQEELLKSLEEFAFTDINLLKNGVLVSENVVGMLEERRNQQKLLLRRLKSQLKELKSFDMNSMKSTWNQLLDHLRTKEDLENQLKIQIVDLERFIQHLQSVISQCICKQNKKTLRNYLIELMERTYSFVQMFTFIFFKCFNKVTEINHWSDLRAKLELAIIDLTKKLRSKEESRKITIAVRRNLAPSISDLIQHGTKTSMMDCFSPVNSTVHSWDIILYYYNFKKGDEFNSSTVQKLSRSFSLEIAGVSPKTNKKHLLYIIDNIKSTHSRYKRSNDSQFTAFICAALNAKSLVSWLNLIFHCDSIIETFYYPWSYVATTKYQDGLKSLDLLTPYKFDLPIDLDVRKFQIEDNLFA